MIVAIFRIETDNARVHGVAAPDRFFACDAEAVSGRYRRSPCSSGRHVIGVAATRLLTCFQLLADSEIIFLEQPRDLESGRRAFR